MTPLNTLAAIYVLFLVVAAAWVWVETWIGDDDDEGRP